MTDRQPLSTDATSGGAARYRLALIDGDERGLRMVAVPADETLPADVDVWAELCEPLEEDDGDDGWDDDGETDLTDYGTADVDQANDLTEDTMAARIDDETRIAGYGESIVEYEAYRIDPDGRVVDNLDEVAVHGQVVLVHGLTGTAPGFRPYLSYVLESPTWLQVAVLASQAVRTTGDFHHAFLEGVAPAPAAVLTAPGVRVYRLLLGS